MMGGLVLLLGAAGLGMLMLLGGGGDERARPPTPGPGPGGGGSPPAPPGGPSHCPSDGDPRVCLAQDAYNALLSELGLSTLDVDGKVGPLTCGAMLHLQGLGFDVPTLDCAGIRPEPPSQVAPVRQGGGQLETDDFEAVLEAVRDLGHRHERECPQSGITEGAVMRTHEDNVVNLGMAPQESLAAIYEALRAACPGWR